MSISNRPSVKWLDLDVTEPVDIKYAVSILGPNSQKLFYSMLEKFESTTIQTMTSKLAEGYSIQNWAGIFQAAHSLKGASGFIGAGKIHYACYYICEAYGKNDYKSMLLYYPLIVEAVIEFKRHSHKLTADYK